MMKMNKGQARLYVAGLSDPGKMPCEGYSIPAATCKIGSKLRKVEGSVCHGCYAFKGRYPSGAVQNAMYRRLEAMKKKYWAEAMITAIIDMPFFRWHDSGDIQNEKHLEKIMDIAIGTPNTMHWLPTREYQMVENVLKKRKKPSNLVIRLSAHMIDSPGPVQLANRIGVQVSEVGSEKYTCPASEQENQCKDCRKCWDEKVFNVVYHKH